MTTGVPCYKYRLCATQGTLSSVCWPSMLEVLMTLVSLMRVSYVNILKWVNVTGIYWVIQHMLLSPT